MLGIFRRYVRTAVFIGSDHGRRNTQNAIYNSIQYTVYTKQQCTVSSKSIIS